MLEHLQARINRTLSQPAEVTLAACGPLGVQVGRFPWQFFQMRIYLSIPVTLDILENLDPGSEVVVSAALWQARGKVWPARADEQAALLGEPGLERLNREHKPWNRMVEVRLERVQLQPFNGWGSEETIDFDRVEPEQPAAA